MWLFLVACIKIPAYLLDPINFEHPQCLVEEHLVAVGFDENSPAIAQEKAKTRVSEQIASQISTVQKRFQESSTVNDSEISFATLTQNTVVQSDFAHYQLIQDVDKVHKSRDGYRALACVNIAEIESTLHQDLQPQLQHLNTLFEQAFNSQDIHQFSSIRQKIFQELPTIKPQLMVLYGLRQSPSLTQQQLDGQLQRLESTASKWRREHPIIITSEIQGTAHLSILEHLQQSLQSGGMSIGEEPGKEAICLELIETAIPEEGPMGGQLLQLQILLEMGYCGSAKRPRIVLGKSQGYHSQDSGLAKKDAYANLGLPEWKKLREWLPLL